MVGGWCWVQGLLVPSPPLRSAKPLRYKACASLTKLGERYGKERLESACARVHAYGTTPSIRNISSILKSKQDVKAKTSTAQEQSSNTARYGITRGASYFANGGEHK